MKTWVVRESGPAGVGLAHGIVGDPGLLPHRVHPGVAVDAELDHEVGDDAEEAHVVEVARADEVVEAVGAAGGPLPVDLDHERALRRLEARPEEVGRARRGLGGIEKRGGAVGLGAALGAGVGVATAAVGAGDGAGVSARRQPAATRGRARKASRNARVFVIGRDLAWEEATLGVYLRGRRAWRRASGGGGRRRG
jgi:hypothetical protein